MSQLVDEDYSKRPWMETFTGLKFWPATPRIEDINIFDIAHALSLKCRYGGHVKWFYSVAEHSVLISKYLRSIGMPTYVQLDALLHDGGEYVLPDIPRPIKHFFPEHKRMEEGLMVLIRRRFGLEDFGNPHPLIKQLDGRMITNERAMLMNPSDNDWVAAEVVPGVVPKGVDPGSAEWAFLQTYQELIFELHGTPKFLWFNPGQFNASLVREAGGPVYDELPNGIPDVRAIDIIGGVAKVNVAPADEPTVDFRYIHGDYEAWVAPEYRREPASVEASGARG